MEPTSEKKLGRPEKYANSNGQGAPYLGSRVEPETYAWARSRPEGLRAFLERIVLEHKRAAEAPAPVISEPPQAAMDAPAPAKKRAPKPKPIFEWQKVESGFATGRHSWITYHPCRLVVSWCQVRKLWVLRDVHHNKGDIHHDKELGTFKTEAAAKSFAETWVVESVSRRARSR